MKPTLRTTISNAFISGGVLTVLLAVVVPLSGCKPDSPDAGNAQMSKTNQGAQGPAAGTGVRRPAPPERPELNADLLAAISAADEQAAIDLVEQGASVNAVDDRGVSVLHHAGRATLPNLTRLLLEYGADLTVSLPDRQGAETGVQPIHWAARAGASDRAGAEETVNVLIEFGADINARTAAGTLPITYATQLGNERFRQFLLSRGSIDE